VRESERRLEAAQRLAHVGWWERDYATGRVSLSEEAGRMLGVSPGTVRMLASQGRAAMKQHLEADDV